jgi:hypothetical protein
MRRLLASAEAKSLNLTQRMRRSPAQRQNPKGETFEKGEALE